MNSKFVEPHWERFAKKVNGYYYPRHEKRLHGVETFYYIHTNQFDLTGRSYNHHHDQLLLDWTDIHIYTEIPSIKEETPIFPPFPLRLPILKSVKHQFQDINEKYNDLHRIVLHPFKVQVRFRYVLRSQGDFDMLERLITDIFSIVPQTVRKLSPPNSLHVKNQRHALK